MPPPASRSAGVPPASLWHACSHDPTKHVGTAALGCPAERSSAFAEYRIPATVAARPEPRIR
jgi:hypothetical protein